MLVGICCWQLSALTDAMTYTCWVITEGGSCRTKHFFFYWAVTELFPHACLGPKCTFFLSRHWTHLLSRFFWIDLLRSGPQALTPGLWPHLVINCCRASPRVKQLWGRRLCRDIWCVGGDLIHCRHRRPLLTVKVIAGPGAHSCPGKDRGPASPCRPLCPGDIASWTISSGSLKQTLSKGKTLCQLNYWCFHSRESLTTLPPYKNTPESHLWFLSALQWELRVTFKPGKIQPRYWLFMWKTWKSR